jgi:hypothetical protein
MPDKAGRDQFPAIFPIFVEKASCSFTAAKDANAFILKTNHKQPPFINPYRFFYMLEIIPASS